MSWQSYIDSLLNSRAITHAIIFGLDGATWASSPGLAAMSAAEKTALIKSFGNIDALHGSGVTVNGKRHIFLRCEEECIKFKKGETGGCVAKTNQTIVVTLYEKGQTGGACTSATMKVVDHLRNSQF